MTAPNNPYDELPYCCAPIEWTAPERLALASLLHGGPRIALDRYRMLELGCGDGSNLIALASYRRHAEFVGVDGSARHIELARARAGSLGLDNLRFIHADLRHAAAALEGRFEIIVAHGVFSWVPDDARDALLRIHHFRLAAGGLFYLNYNAEPGWSVRGLVRRFMLAQPCSAGDLLGRAQAAQAAAGRLAETLERAEHAYSALLAGELRLAAEADPSYVAHEYLNPDNRAYWHSEFTALAAAQGLTRIVDADFDRPSGRDDDALDAWLATEGLAGPSQQDTADLLRYRQLRSPILTTADWVRRPPGTDELARLRVAASLAPVGPQSPLPAKLEHASGRTLDCTDESIRAGLVSLRSHWPRGRVVSEVFPDIAAAMDDLLLLHRHGIVELRCVEPDDFAPAGDALRLHALEAELRGDVTTPHHRRVAR